MEDILKPYTFELGSLTEPRARLALVSPREPSVVTRYSTNVAIPDLLDARGQVQNCTSLRAKTRALAATKYSGLSLAVRASSDTCSGAIRGFLLVFWGLGVS